MQIWNPANLTQEPKLLTNQNAMLTPQPWEKITICKRKVLIQPCYRQFIAVSFPAYSVS